MKKYIVTKKCYANEFVTVEATSEKEALEKAANNEEKQLTGYLEFSCYQPVETWSIEQLSTEHKRRSI